MWKLNEAGFVDKYMVAGPKAVPYETEIQEPNMMVFERKVRREVVSPKASVYTGDVRVGEAALCGEPWRVYYSSGNYFIDKSYFYSTLQKVSMEAATVLVVEEDITVDAVIWGYISVGLYCNGELVAEEAEPRYKPISKKEFKLSLKKGRNEIVMVCETLGVRDTRTIVGLQIVSDLEKIQVTLPDESVVEQVQEATDFAEGIYLVGNELVFGKGAPKGTVLVKHLDSQDHFARLVKPAERLVEGLERVELDADSHIVTVKIPMGSSFISRTIEYDANFKPKYSPEGIDAKQNEEEAFKRIAAIQSFDRGEEFGFAICGVLARRHLGLNGPEEIGYLRETLDLIEERVDCSDFILCGWIRFVHAYGCPQELEDRAKEVLTGFRYWLNNLGSDAMCFWSENHSLMFYECAMHVGEMYPDAYFDKAQMTGAELREYGKKKVLDWLSDVEEYGFEEFLSTVYMYVTFAALLNTVDFSEQEISRRAVKILDKMFEMLAEHTFKGAVVAPMGRVYRGVIHPFAQGTQELLNVMNPKAITTESEGWLAFYATSKYELPTHFNGLMDEEIDTDYTTGNARIFLTKKKDYCVTSVASPRKDVFTRWENIVEKAGVDTDTHEFNKSYNERFHGTSCFASGVYGYQQNLMYMALDTEAVTFITHPGTTLEASGLRPGYWDGNGIMPAITQEHNKIGLVFQIPDKHPIGFTHVYFPKGRFDQVVFDGNWIFAKKDHGLMALWCSEEYVPHNDMLFDCEWRAYSRNVAYYGMCESLETYGSFEDFMEVMKGKKPVYDMNAGVLSDADGFTIRYEAYEDTTQYLD